MHMKKLCYILLPLLLIFSGCGDVEWFPERTTPEAFSFRARNNVSLSTIVTSEAITIKGISVPATISVSNGEYAIGGTDGEGTYTTVPGKISSGQTVTVRHTSADLNQSSTSTVLTVGGMSAVFTSTTIAPQLPVAVTKDPSGTFDLLDNAVFSEDTAASDQTTVIVDVMIDLRNTSATSEYAQVDYAAKDAAGNVLQSDFAQSELLCPPLGIAALVKPMIFTRATFAKIASWQVTISVAGGDELVVP